MRVKQKPTLTPFVALTLALALGAVASRARSARGTLGLDSPGVQDGGPSSTPPNVSPHTTPIQGGSPHGRVDSKLKDFVRVQLEGSPTDDEKKLAEVVKKELEHRQPQNPGRRKTFGVLAFRGLTPQNRETHVLKQTGWYLMITGVRREPDGWRAWVSVFALLTKRDGNLASASNKHFEIYRFKNGELTLEEDYVDPLPLTQDPNYNPSQGLLEIPVIGGNPKPVKPPPFVVQIFLDGTPTEQVRALASEVEKVLKEKQPGNPGRDKTFARMEFRGFGPDGKPQLWKMKRLSWRLVIRHVERVPDGWRATIHVYIRAVSPEGIEPRIFNHHLEVYTYRDGKLTLESESIDPNWDPSQGLSGALM